MAKALLLAPGAGAGRDQSGLVAVDHAVSALGLSVGRMDFAYRKAGRRAPDRPAVLLAAVRAEAEGLAQRTKAAPGAIVLGGRSMGGRICSMAVTDGLDAAGLVLISYPLHPPGRAEKRRDEHFARIKVPCLFVSGTRDAFATPDELQSATVAIAAPVAHAWVDGADHAMRRPAHDEFVAAVVADWIKRLD
ncbi:MAG: alpha/beta hydrolase family protein [Acidimicrobiales bacterium]